MAYKVVDLFAGAGGLSLGFMQTGKFEIVAAAENNPGARKTYKRNHKLTRLYPDVRTIDYRELEESCGKIDVVIGGPPCQGFSNANRQHTTIISMNNRLVKEYVRAVRELEPEAFVMENVAMLKSNIHRFMVEETDIDDPIIMGLTLSEDKIELLPKGINFPDAVNFAKNSSNIKTYLWDEKELKAITVLYRFRINRPKFANSVERYRKYLTKLLTDIMASNDEDWVRTQEREMAQILIAYMNGEEIEFDALIRAIEIPLSVQRMLGRMQELLDNTDVFCVCGRFLLVRSKYLIVFVSIFGKICLMGCNQFWQGLLADDDILDLNNKFSGIYRIQKAVKDRCYHIIFPILAAIEAQNKDVCAALSYLAAIGRINGYLLFYRSIFICSVKSDTLRSLTFFILKAGKTGYSLIRSYTITIQSAIKNSSKSRAGIRCKFTNAKRAAVRPALVRCALRLGKITPRRIVFFIRAKQPCGVGITDS